MNMVSLTKPETKPPVSFKLPSERGMIVYPTTTVKLSYQDVGSNLLMIMRGTQEDIELNFNGFYNWGATNSTRHEYIGHLKDTCLFWSTPDNMHKFFFNTCKHDDASAANDYAEKKMQELFTNSEFFRNFNRKAEDEFGNAFAGGLDSGTIKAEKPDNDFKDEAYAHAFRNLNSSN